MIIDLGSLSSSSAASAILGVEKVLSEFHRLNLLCDPALTDLDAGGFISREQSPFAAMKCSMSDQFSQVPELGFSGRFDLAFLPPNLRGHRDQVSLAQVFDYVEDNSIPIYGVPRGEIALRLVEAETLQQRRRILTDYSDKILDDCESAIDVPVAREIEKLRPFVEEALLAARNGFTKSAQALFTTVLDTMLSICWKPDQEVSKKLKRRNREEDFPTELDDLTVREALVWLPVRNAHLAYWPNNKDPIPHQYSRHASVHRVCPTQYNQRNCLQAAMLVCSVFYSRRLKSASGVNSEGAGPESDAAGTESGADEHLSPE